MFGSKKSDEEKVRARHLNKVRVAAASAGVTMMGGNFKAAGQIDVPVDGAKVTIEKGEEAQARVTATRVILAGPFALLMKKDRNQLFITIEGADGSVLVQPVAAKKEDKARIFATLVNGAATGVTKQPAE